MLIKIDGIFSTCDSHHSLFGRRKFCFRIDNLCKRIHLCINVLDIDLLAI